MHKRTNLTSGVPWESIVSYSRAVRIGDVVEVSGTVAATEGGEVVGEGDAYLQTKAILQKIEQVLLQAGAELKHVVRTRMFVTDISQWQEIGRAHGEVFAAIKPCTTMVEVKSLIAPEYLIEIEATAIIS